MKNLLTLLFISILHFTTLGQDMLPTVINVKSDTKILEQLSTEYKSSLFAASDMDFNKTSKNWKHLLSAMEMYAEEIDFELKGIQVWMKLYFDKSGTIDYITYFLMDKSINIDTTDLEAFLRSFVKNYKIPVSHKSKFSYDARIQFPIYMMR